MSSRTAAIHLFVALVSCWLAAGQLPARARVNFTPSLQVSETYTENVNFTGDAEDDWITRLTLVLPLATDLRRSRFSLVYSPTIERFASNSDLDHDDHALAMNVGTNRKTVSSSFGLSYMLSQRQGVIATETPFEVLVRRVENETIRANAGLSKRVTRRWSWNVGLEGTISRFERLRSVGSDPAGNPNDRQSYGANIGFARTVSKLTSLGIDVGRRVFSLDAAPDETVDQLSFTVHRVLGERHRLVSYVGASRRTRTSTAAGDPGGRSDQVQGKFEYRQQMRRVRLNVTLNHRPSLGAAVNSTSTDTRVGVFVSSVDGGGTRQLLDTPKGRRWNWRVGGTTTKSDPDGPDNALTARGISGQFGWRPIPRLGIGVNARYIEQSEPGGTSREASLFSAGIGVSWIIRRR